MADVGVFNTDFYMYFEDTELCTRVLKAGYKVRVVPNARVVHAKPIPGTAPDYVTVHNLKNFLAMYLIHARLRVLPEFLFRTVFLAAVRDATSNRPHLKHQLAAWRWTVRHLPKLVQERRRVSRLGIQ